MCKRLGHDLIGGLGTMTKPDPERVERRRQQAEIADSLEESGALDEIFARIDAGEPLTGHEGLAKGC